MSDEPTKPQKAKQLDQSAPVVAPADEFPLTLDEFCSQLSQVDKRVELIGGFHYTEKVAGRLKDTRAAYQARYVSFLTQPA